jgi:peptide deformylase
MTVRSVCIAGDPVLHRPTRPVTEFGPELRRLVGDMFETMYVAQGVGLAANQIGVDRRVFVYDCPDDDGVWHSGVVVNPRLVAVGAATDDTEPVVVAEGCLSVPGQKYDTPRAAAARVVGFDLAGEPVQIDASGYLARCFQHEVDHLDGHLYLELLASDIAGAARQTLKADHQDGSWLPTLPADFTGPITRDTVFDPERRRGPLAAAEADPVTPR